MDWMLENLARYQRAIVGVLVAIVGIFIVVLIFSGPGDVAQALGNLIGAAIGAFGAGAAVVWQLERKRRDDDSYRNQIRRVAFDHIGPAFVENATRMKAATELLEAGDDQTALLYASNNMPRSLVVDPQFDAMLRELAPEDEFRIRRLNETAKKISAAAWVHRNANTKPGDVLTSAQWLRDEMLRYADQAAEFLSQHYRVVARGHASKYEFEGIRKTLLDSGKVSVEARLDVMRI